MDNDVAGPVDDRKGIRGALALLMIVATLVGLGAVWGWSGFGYGCLALGAMAWIEYVLEKIEYVLEKRATRTTSDHG